MNSLPQEIEIDHSVGVGVQKELPRIAALSNVMWNTLCNYTGQTCHRGTKISENVPSVLGFPILLFCCEYNPMTGRYDLLVSRVLALCAAVTILLLGGMVLLLLRFDRKRKDSGNALASYVREAG